MSTPKKPEVEENELSDKQLEGVDGGARHTGSSKDHGAPAPRPPPYDRDLDDLEVER